MALIETPLGEPQGTTTTTMTTTTNEHRNEKQCERSTTEVPSIGALRQSIPKHCFEPSTATSLSYIVRDLLLVTGVAMFAYQNIPSIDYWPLRWCAWGVYGFVQGLIFTGIWILAHECGHGAFFKHNTLNHAFGFALHSMLLVPFYSWKFTHARHHRYTNNMDKDTAFVPAREGDHSFTKAVEEYLDLAEDTPLLTAAVLLGHQLLGWPFYMLFSITAGEDSIPSENTKSTWHKSHLDPLADLWTTQQQFYILLSDLGLAATAGGLFVLGQWTSPSTAALLYVLPWLWVNHWIVAITFLHHTHPDISHYEDEAWTFQKGALGTVDRDFGFVGKHLFHGIIEFHVIHHLFPRIPFYHAEEATHSIRPLLGDHYIQETKSFWGDLWKTFVQCKYVVPSSSSGVLEWQTKTPSKG